MEYLGDQSLIGTSIVNPSNKILGGYFQMGVNEGVGVSITVKMMIAISTGAYAKCALYDSDKNLVPNSETEEKALTVHSIAPETFNFGATKPVLTANAWYYVVVWAVQPNGSISCYYNPSGANGFQTQAQTYGGSFPPTYNPTTTPNATLAIYCTYYSKGYPIIQSKNRGMSGGNTMNHTINLPSGITAGDLLLIFFSTDGSPTVNWNGFTQVLAGSNSSQVFLGVAYKIATGNEGSTIVITTNASERSTHVTYRITNFFSNAPFSIVGKFTGAASTAWTCPTLTVSNTKKYLWIAVGGHDGAGGTASYITGYNLEHEGISDNSSQGCTTAVCGRNLTTNTQTPTGGSWMLSDETSSATLAIFPLVQPLASILSVETKPTPISNQIYQEQVIITNTGDISGTLWIKAWRDGNYKGIQQYTNVPVNGKIYSYWDETATTQKQDWVFQTGTNPDQITYDVQKTDKTYPVQPRIDEIDSFTITVTKG